MAKVRRKAARRKPSRETSPKPKEISSFDLFTSDLLKQSGYEAEDAEALKQFVSLSKTERVKESRAIIQRTVIEGAAPDARFALAVAESESLLQGYTTLDDHHRADIKRLIEMITSYLRDPTRKRPLNALMLASPGAGKSHFIKQLARKMRRERVQAVTFNMSTMQSPDDMAQPIDELRNLKVNDQFPLLFLDEFDSDVSRYAALLPLLWDGELQIGHRDLKLGKAVIVLAGSNPDLPKVMDRSTRMGLDTSTDTGLQGNKLIDLLSRINGGVLTIPELDLRTENRDRRVDKVCVAISLMRIRFGNELERIPRSLVRFIALTTFRYGVRSIAHLVDTIASEAFDNKVLKRDELSLPLSSERALQESSLKLHLLDKDQAFGVVNRWNELSSDSVMLNLRETPLHFFQAGEHWVTIR